MGARRPRAQPRNSARPVRTVDSGADGGPPHQVRRRIRPSGRSGSGHRSGHPGHRGAGQGPLTHAPPARGSTSLASHRRAFGMVVGMTTMVILVSCPDQPGIVARITGRLYAAGANILTLEQHVEEGQLFFMRIVADVSRVADTTEMREGLQGLAAELAADLLVKDADERQRLAILVSRDGACLEDLLSKQRAGEINCEIPLVIGNTEALRGIAEISGIPFYCVPSQPGVGGPHEQRLLELMAAARVDAIVLARYMKVLSREFVAEYENRMINIHHGFLPAFKGARP